MFTRARLVLASWYAVALAATVLAIGLVAYFVVQQQIDKGIDNSLSNARASLLAPMPEQGQPGYRPPPSTGYGTTPVAPSNGTFFGPDEQETARRAATLPSDVFYVTTDASGTVLANPRTIDLENLDFATLIAKAGPSGYWRQDLGNYRTATFRSNTDAGWYLTVGRSLQPRDEQLRTLALVLSIGGFAGVVFSAAGGLWLAGVALRPIRSSLELQRRFVSDASHELRTPLAVVKANGELLLRHPDSTIEDNFDQVEAITAETDHMTRLVENLLTLARADEGNANLLRESLDLGALVEDTGRDMAALAELHEITLTVTTQPAQVDGDSHRLRQLLVILVDNALKYTPTGGKVAVLCQRNGRSVDLSVSDTGHGISAEDQRRIFDRFYRVDSARARSAGGSGLGLAIARYIAEAHDGRITVESKPGQGAKFTVRLPAA